MVTATAHNGDVQIAYETFGSPGGRPLLLLNGLDYQMVWWPEDLCTALADHGFQVARFDYRDCGLSTHFASPRRENAWKAMVAGTGSAPPYSSSDMADDAVAVIDALGWDQAHLLGVSMGAGMAQILALAHPQRVRSLTLVAGLPMGGNPARNVRHLHLGVFVRLALRRYGDDRASQERMLVDVIRATCTPCYPLEEDWARATATRSYDRRPPDPTARQRHLGAGRAAKLPKDAPAAIQAPTLVIHGQDDPLVKPSASRALAGVIPGARLLIFPGMGHGLPRALWPTITAELDRLTQ
jgi:pimeloyl-ACP methyl ester carboxylesterase